MVARIEVVTGCMYSGKTSELLRQAERWERSKRPFLLFKPKIDNRFSDNEINSHCKESRQATVISKPSEILSYVTPDILFIAIEEAQFFDDDIVRIVLILAFRNIQVVIAGLDMDSRGEPFGAMGKLMQIANTVTKFTAICDKCGEEAQMTQRLIDQKPAPYNSEIIAVGGSELYEARCRSCHEVPGHPYL